MRPSRTVLLAGAAALGLTGMAHFAQAEPANTHVMTVQLPNGAVEQIRYTGDVPPEVILAPDAAAFESPFTVLERMSALMDRQAEAMLRAVSTMAAQPLYPPTTEAAFGRLPPGASVCMQSVEITYTGNGQPPHVVTRSAGECGPSHGASVPAELPGSPAPVQDHQRTRPCCTEVGPESSRAQGPPIPSVI